MSKSLYYPIQSLNPINGYKPSFKRFWGMGECLYEWVADRGTESNGKGLICNVVIINGL
jgi:hypothetical protein